ncbi:2-oxoacid dehydrogenases acyltransferase-domain-containing protein [Coprinopsis sp. MPI-PUGE-AT-0042]|nr:2-oxoacid dehydrogenases acyltransferase-domain-containing protein [Coprinopsis sp. MPI-PUGE-AT-0042]
MVPPRIRVPVGCVRRTTATVSLSSNARSRLPLAGIASPANARFLSSLPRPQRLRMPLARRGLHTTVSRSSAAKTFNLADIGEGITECEIIKWSITPGARISAFDPLCEVQSDKASVEITSPFDGVVKTLLVQEGEIAKVGGGLCVIEVDSEDAAADAGSATPPPAAIHDSSLQAGSGPEPTSPAASQVARKLHPLDPSNPNPGKSLGVRPKRGGAANPSIIRSKDLLSAPLEAQQDLLLKQDQTMTPFLTTSSTDILATPQVRHFAKDMGLMDLSVLGSGSGRDGRIEKSDVEAYLQKAKNASAASGSSSTPASTPTDQETVVELGRTRYNMWKAMEKSLEIPHFGYSTSLDITELHNLLPALNASIPTHFLPQEQAERSARGMLVNPNALFPAPQPTDIPESGKYTKLTYLPFLLKTLAMTMMEWPLLRGSITPNTPAGTKPTMTIRPTSDIALALSTPTGLYTPTILGTNTHSVFSIASKLKHLSYLGRQTPSGLTPKEMPKKGGTITVSNVGAVGKGEVASPVLVPGGGIAIVAIGRAKWFWGMAEVAGTSMRGQRRLKLPISWSADHRVVEGAELAAFVETWRSYVEKPAKLIGTGV